MAEFLAVLFLWEGASIAPWRGPSRSVGSRGAPCLRRAARAAGVWTPRFAPSQEHARSAQLSGVERAPVPPNGDSYGGALISRGVRGGPRQAKPLFPTTGASRAAVCKAPNPFLLLMKPFFTLKALLQGTKAHCCDPVGLWLSTSPVQSWPPRSLPMGARAEGRQRPRVGSGATCSGRLQKRLFPLMKKLKIKQHSGFINKPCFLLQKPFSKD